jgi:hypothetical protein
VATEIFWYLDWGFAGSDRKCKGESHRSAILALSQSWWVLNQRALIEMLRCVGFSRVDIMSKLALSCSRTGVSYEHLVTHATV